MTKKTYAVPLMNLTLQCRAETSSWLRWVHNMINNSDVHVNNINSNTSYY